MLVAVLRPGGATSTMTIGVLWSPLPPSIPVSPLLRGLGMSLSLFPALAW